MAPGRGNQRCVCILVFVLLLAICTKVMGDAHYAEASVEHGRSGELAAGQKTRGSHSQSYSYSFQSSSSSSSGKSSSSSSSVSSHSESSQHRSASAPSRIAGYEVSGSSGSQSKEMYAGRTSNRASVVIKEPQRSRESSASVSSQEPQRSHESSASVSSQSSSVRSHAVDSADRDSRRMSRQDANQGRRSQDRAESHSGGRSSAAARSSSRSQAAEGSAAARKESRGRQRSGSRDMSELDRVSALSSDSDQRSYFKRLFSRRCKDCEVNGETYRGHSRFEYSEDCKRYRCICRCNGTHTCPPRYTMKVCGEGQEEGKEEAVAQDRYMKDLRRRRCQTCEVLGQKFDGNAYFDYTDGCTRFRGCVCYCNGTWVCPSERAIDICQVTTPTPTSVCKACNANGKVVSANSLFEREEPCWRYRYCRCHCNGTWDCPERFAENTCQSPTANPREITHPGCKACETPDKREVAGNTYFQMTLGCKQYKNCVCRCNGSWTCPDNYVRDTCGNKDADGRPKADSNARHLPPTSAECQSCLAHGRYFRGNTYFSTRRGCTGYERCVCRCDGSWDCPGRFASDLCRDDDPTNDEDNPNATCSFCEAEGKIIPPNSFFNMSKRCVDYSQCLCHCDGAWTCPEKYSVNTCDGGPPKRVSPEPERDCNSCHVNSRVVRGNSYFDYTSACFRYRDCICKCDGTYHCEQSRALDICKYSTTSSPSSDTSSPSSSSSVVVTPAPSCVRCLAFGQLHDWDTDFVHEEDCVEYECHCHCNGTYVCPMDRARRTCQPGCQECEVGGQFFEGNTYFQHTRGCIDYLCTCYCNGSFFCPADRANYTCAGGLGDRRIPPLSDITVQEEEEEDRGQCQQCVTKDGVRHAPGQDFELTEGCIHYRCHCNCDGSWNCPGQDARNTCRGEVLGGCRSCVISDSQIYRGGEEFAMRQGCTHYQCRCNCDGSWRCPGELARDICLGEVPGGCRVCRVSSKEMYRGGSTFQLRQGCYHYQCQCHCNGSWECPGNTARDVCIGEVPGGCRVCRLDSGEIHLGESDFQMVKNCIHYNCRCNCDGSWNCPGSKARRVCNADGSPLRELPTTTAEPPPARCERCLVSDREQFLPNQPFTVRRGCNVHRCDCQCDGTYNCPPSRTRDLCRRREDPQLRAQTCSPCRVSSFTYPGQSSFLLTRGCAQYSCQCDCRGRWSCDHQPDNLCQGNRPRSPPAASVRDPVLSSVSSDRDTRNQYRSLVSDVKPKVFSTAQGSSVSAANLGSSQTRSQVSAPCRPCRVEGREHAPNTDFVLNRPCKRFHCRCSCSGRWRCPRSKTILLCDDQGNKDVGRRTSSVHIKAQGAGEGQQYGRANIRVVGADTAPSSSSLSSGQSRSQVERQGQESKNVRGYYVNTAQQSFSVDSGQAGPQPYGQADNRRGVHGGSRPADSGQPHPQPSRKQDGRPARGRSPAVDPVEGGGQEAGMQFLGSEVLGGQVGGSQVGAKADGVCTPCEVDDKRYRKGAHFDWRRGCLVYKCTCLCSGSYRCRVSLDHDCEDQGTPEAGGIPTGPAQSGTPARLPGGACGNCYVQGLLYPGNMSFTLRQGCQQLHCRCRCDGSHQCAEPEPIPGCVAMSTPLGGSVNPYWAGSSVYPIGGGAYGVRPGRVINTFQQTYFSSCPTCGHGHGSGLLPGRLGPQPLPGQIPGQSQTPGQGQGQGQIPGQSQGQGQGQGSQQPSGHYRYPLAAQAVPGSGASSSGAHVQSGAGHHDQQSPQYPSSPQYLGNPQYPMNPQYPANPQTPLVNPQQPVNPQHLRQAGSGRGHSRTYVQHIPLQPIPIPHGVMTDSQVDHRCAICFVNGQSQQGHFQYVKDCSHVTCHCDCSGRLQCSMQHAQVENCLAAPRPPSPRGQCVSCLVNGQEYPPHLQFAQRVGCYGYDCTCDCNGVWMCPMQEPRNYCVKPDTPPEGVVDDRRGVLAMESGQVGPGHSHAGGKAGLRDAVYSRSAEQEDSLLSCQDCEVRGTTYPSRTRFLLRDGCDQHSCHCACDGSWACNKNLTVDVCKTRCRPCQWANDTYKGGSSFTHTVGCWQFGCQCACDGEVTCPAALAKDLCRAGDSQAMRERLNEQNGQQPLPLDCTPCMVDGQLIRSRTAFSRKMGCWESLCTCECNGTSTCPADRSINTCQLKNDDAPQPAKHQGEGQGPRRKGCTVGRKTYYTRLFAFRDGCKQLMCVCYDNGTWRCHQGTERRVC